ncbi:MAG: hypothetical protein N0C84_17050 [Candidatus Thiodiazotropha taylori]|uniref:BstA-like C-terminal domain-containing protein n=1 Tax=Candidatus Thiodiazotropha taylori TaxID=2792791 RepID=A0A9E4N5V4_9GAMM|nr:hypothetical protein [Candidatus Thiodiazotropha taylori]MCW4258175.1 hypothetical protein [Candidatus Thiodiazotropha taylori]
MKRDFSKLNTVKQQLTIADTVSVGGYQLHMLDDEPMIQDLHLADRLGYDRPRRIRELIKKMIDRGQLKPEQVRRVTRRTPKGGPPHTIYHLNEHACIKVITRSGTDLADQITDEVIDVFIAARRGEIHQPTLKEKYAQVFLEMAAINPPTPGFYSIVKASSDMLFACLSAGLPFDEHNLAIISIGQYWRKHYDQKNLSKFYGEPKRYRQRYPDSFPQAAMNDHKKVWHYPTSSLEAFERWLTMEYLPKHYPNYLSRKVKLGHITADTKLQLIDAVNDRFLLASA